MTTTTGGHGFPVTNGHLPGSAGEAAADTTDGHPWAPASISTSTSTCRPATGPSCPTGICTTATCIVTTTVTARRSTTGPPSSTTPMSTMTTDITVALPPATTAARRAGQPPYGDWKAAPTVPAEPPRGSATMRYRSIAPMQPTAGQPLTGEL